MILRKFHFALLYLFVYCKLMMVFKGRITIVKLINDTTEGPKISFGRAIVFLDQLRRHVTKLIPNLLARPYKGWSPLLFAWRLLFVFLLFGFKFIGVFSLLFHAFDSFLERIGDKRALGDLSGPEVDEFEVATAGKHDIFGLNKKSVTLMSLWTTPTEWRYYKMLTISAI